MSVQELEDTMKQVAHASGNTIYLCGPIRKATDNGREWRNSLIKEYSDTYDFRNPLDEYDPETHDVLNDPIEYDENSDKKQVMPQEYIFTDKMNILESDYVFVGLPEVISRGSCMEMMFCYFEDIPYFVWTMNGQQESGWITHHAKFVDADRDRVMEAINNHE